jgi:hypothetical protein
MPNRTKWHQQTYQRLPDEEQTYSLRLPECQSKQMNVLEWLVGERDIGIDPAQTTRTAIWPLELGGVGKMENTSETLKHQKLLIQGFRHVAKLLPNLYFNGLCTKAPQN